MMSPDTVYRFEAFLAEGILPGGRYTSFPLLRRDEIELMSRPYNTWAPAPWNQLNYCLNDKAVTEFFGQYVSGIWMPARMHILKAKLWAGMVGTTLS
jgi:hypothetical protein